MTDSSLPGAMIKNDQNTIALTETKAKEITTHSGPELTIEAPSVEEKATDVDKEEASAAATSNGPEWSVWSPKEKKMIIFAASFGSLFSPMTGQIYLPALNTIAKDLHVSNSLVVLSITTYLVSLLIPLHGILFYFV